MADQGTATPLYGLLAEFAEPQQLLRAARAIYADGYRRLDAYSPFPIHELSDAIGVHGTRVPMVVLLGGLLGGAAGYFLQYWVAALHYPLNVGGRPLHSWPAFIPVTFECTILFAAVSAVAGMFLMNGLPRPYHPLFGADGFERASQDRFFLCVQADDPRFDLERTRERLLELRPRRLQEVPK